MLNIHFNIDELLKLENVLENAEKNILKRMDKALHLSANEIRTIAQKKIQKGPRSGRKYKRTKNGIVHQASAPGEPPKADRGGLVPSIHVNYFKLKPEVGSPLVYAAALEDGARSSLTGFVKMQPRPWLSPSLAEAMPKIKKLLLSALEKSFEK